MQILVMTSAKYHHLLNGFCYMFNGYWPDQSVIIATDTPISQDLPENFSVHSYSDWKPLPASKWSNGLRHALNSIGDGIVTLLLEDYYLNAPVDVEVVEQGIEIMKHYHNDLLRFDLTTDRMYNGYVKDLGKYGILDLVETPFESEYQMSFQAGMWNRRLLLSIIPNGLSPWQAEMYIQPPEEMRVFGTKQHPVKYANVIMTGGTMGPKKNYEGISEEHMQVMRERGWIDE
jgi:hypothetical protein